MFYKAIIKDFTPSDKMGCRNCEGKYLIQIFDNLTEKQKIVEGDLFLENIHDSRNLIPDYRLLSNAIGKDSYPIKELRIKKNHDVLKNLNRLNSETITQLIDISDICEAEVAEPEILFKF